AEYAFFRNAAIAESKGSQIDFKVQQKQIALQLQQIKDRQSKLADAYVDQVFDKELYSQKMADLLIEERTLKHRLGNLTLTEDPSAEKLNAFLELVNSAYLSYKIAKPDERRDLVRMITSNFLAV